MGMFDTFHSCGRSRHPTKQAKQPTFAIAASVVSPGLRRGLFESDSATTQH